MVRSAMTESEKKDPETPPEPPQDPKPEDENRDDRSDPNDPEDPVSDLRQGIGLLFRAARKAAQGAAHKAKDAAQGEKVEKAFKTGVDDLQKAFDRLQSDKLEGALKSSLQEIGRAVGNVAQTIERELRGDDDHGDKNDKKD